LLLSLQLSWVLTPAAWSNCKLAGLG